MYGLINFDNRIHPGHHHHTQNIKYFHHLKKFLHTALQSFPCISDPRLTTNLLSAQISFAYSKILYRKYIEGTFVCLRSFAQS